MDIDLGTIGPVTYIVDKKLKYALSNEVSILIL